MEKKLTRFLKYLSFSIFIYSLLVFYKIEPINLHVINEAFNHNSDSYYIGNQDISDEFYSVAQLLSRHPEPDISFDEDFRESVHLLFWSIESFYPRRLYPPKKTDKILARSDNIKYKNCDLIDQYMDISLFRC